MDRNPGTSRRNLFRACLAAALPPSPPPPQIESRHRPRPTAAPIGRRRSAFPRPRPRPPAPLPAPGSPPPIPPVSSPSSTAPSSPLRRRFPIAAWKRIARPTEVVGLKVNCLSGRGNSTSTVLVEAVCERLQQAGIPRANIVVWDRLDSDLEAAGFPVSSRKDRIRYIGNDAAGYETDLAIYGSVGSLLSTTLTRTCDAVVNLPVLKDHGIVGVTMASRTSSAP